MLDGLKSAPFALVVVLIFLWLCLVITIGVLITLLIMKGLGIYVLGAFVLFVISIVIAYVIQS